MPPATASTTRRRRPPAAAPRVARDRSRRRRGATIRWDRVGRFALVGVLGVILLLYVSPISNWVSQSRTAERHRAELRMLERENAVLAERSRALSSPEAVEREARRLGMVRRGERPIVVQGLPAP